MERFQTRDLLLPTTIAALAVVIRLVAINQPFTDAWSWRQSDVAAIARNYFTGGFHFAHPQIDWCGGAPGYVGTEFPILPFSAALCYKLAGVREWIGRLQAVVFFAISLPFFFGLVRRAFNETAATWALVFYCFVPLSIMTSRCFMPDMPSLSLSMVGLYYFVRWTETESRAAFALSAFALALALLIKLPNIIIGAPVACVAIERFGRSATRRLQLWLLAIVVLLPSAIWYCHAYDIARRFPPHHFFGAGGVRLMPPSWYWRILRQTVTLSVTIVPFLLAIAGMLLTGKSRRSAMFYCWLTAIAAFIIVVGYGNRHAWYQLPLVPVIAAFAGCAMEWVWRDCRGPRWGRIVTVVLAISLFAAQAYAGIRKFYRPAAADLQSLGLALKATTPPGSLIVIADYGDPTGLYYGERNGWHFLETDGIYNGHPWISADAIADLEHLRQQGATHIAFYSSSFWWLQYYPEFSKHLAETSTLLTATPAYRIFELHR